MDRRPANSTDLALWEQRHRHSLPADLKSFYLTTDGLTVTWKLECNKASLSSLGRIHINSLSDLKRLRGTPRSRDASCLQASLADIDLSDDDCNDGERERSQRPHFDHRSDLFELDTCEPYGVVVLAYGSVESAAPCIWFLDRSLQWHWLADSFGAYFRLSVLHLGLPEWQNLFTPTGISPAGKKWFYLFAPERLRLDESTTATGSDKEQGLAATPSVRLDVERLNKTRAIVTTTTTTEIQERSKSRPLTTGASQKPFTAGIGGKPKAVTASRSATSAGPTRKI
ncbi:tubulin polyglutamylase complex subunit 2-like [Oscarella lobularis]|uniref:tubulin polyglutamylase complex subunit 2-like n=1 Tax=Oscarella lobularis TaxID=121494 RepID=UPI003313BCBE